MGRLLILLLVLLCLVSPAAAQLRIGIGLPSVSIGINLPSFPALVRIAGYPAYYAPRLDANFFFYDGLYWVYQRNNWYASSWYNGPWGLVAPDGVPLFVLRIPLRYYRHPPATWSGWQREAPPRWGAQWGPEWEQRRSGWNRWDRRAVPVAAPAPRYQERYSRERYPTPEEQDALHRQHYQHQPQDPIIRQHYQEHGGQGTEAPALSPRGEARPGPEHPQQNRERARGERSERGRGRNK